jgi:hypothetical protein
VAKTWSSSVTCFLTKLKRRKPFILPVSQDWSAVSERLCTIQRHKLYIFHNIFVVIKVQLGKTFSTHCRKKNSKLWFTALKRDNYLTNLGGDVRIILKRHLDFNWIKVVQDRIQWLCEHGDKHSNSITTGNSRWNEQVSTAETTVCTVHWPPLPSISRRKVQDKYC